MLDSPKPRRVLATGARLIVEEKVPIIRELAAVVARSPFGQGAAWPVVETVQRDGICVEVIAPAPGLTTELAEEAQRMALRIAAELDVVGVLAVELFETTDGGWSSTSWPCVRTTPRTGRSRAPARRSSSSTCAPCSTTRSATPP